MKNANKQSLHFMPMLFLFLLYASYTYLFCIDTKDWWVENILVICFLAYLSVQRSVSNFKFQTFSYVCIFCFLALHEWGAQYCYSNNPLGYALQNSFGLQRNAYDRLVHTAFGFLLYYPLRELLHYKYKVQLHKIPMRALEIILCFTSIFELIEFAVANYIFPDTLGKTYLGTQGDIWDAQKDITVALIGCLAAICLHGMCKKIMEIVASKSLVKL